MKVTKFLSLSAVALFSLGLSVIAMGVSANADETNSTSISQKVDSGNLSEVTSTYTNPKSSNTSVNGDNDNLRTYDLGNLNLSFNNSTANSDGWTLSTSLNNLNATSASQLKINDITSSQPDNNKNAEKSVVTKNKPGNVTLTNDSNNTAQILLATENKPGTHGEGDQSVSSNMQLIIPTSGNYVDGSKTYAPTLTWTLTGGTPQSNGNGSTTKQS